MAKTRAPMLGASFADWGGTFCVVDCLLNRVRGPETKNVNGLIAGFATGGILSFRGGVFAATKQAVSGGALLSVMETAMSMMAKKSLTPREAFYRSQRGTGR
eukprot:GHVO01023541.1.p1 GENE.GHVO01023541.1~~GHVO01023541.1.p1  ORF type:complete len:120 (+),score=9.66 GHVO01023541.1:55-360(+)